MTAFSYRKMRVPTAIAVGTNFVTKTANIAANSASGLIGLTLP
jgi:hypothetical protein